MHDPQLQRFSYALKAFNYICSAKLAAENFLARDHLGLTPEWKWMFSTEQNKTDLYIRACNSILCTELQVPEKAEIKKQNDFLHPYQ